MPRNNKPIKVSQGCPQSPTGGHWWKIGTPDGVTSNGVCWHCGQQRQFANTLDTTFNAGRKR